MRVLVTGNKGYIGAVLCKKLIEEGFDVVGIDSGFFDGCEFFPKDYAIKQISKDIRDISSDDLTGINAIIHLAALSNDPLGELNPALTREINYLASVRLAQLAKNSGVERFVFSSSCSVYGISGDEFINENGMLAPATEYAKSKVDVENDISKMADNGFSPIFLRNATVYGVSPMLRVDLVVNNLTGCAYTSGKIKVLSDGTPWRPLIHIQDVCRAFAAVLKAPKKVIHNQVFNVGKNSENYRVKDIVGVIKEVMPECVIEYTGEHGADTRTYRVDFSKFCNQLAQYFTPEWDIKKGVKELIAGYKTHSFEPVDFISHKFTRLKAIKKALEEDRIDKGLFWRRNA